MLSKKGTIPIPHRTHPTTDFHRTKSTTCWINPIIMAVSEQCTAFGADISPECRRTEALRHVSNANQKSDTHWVKHEDGKGATRVINLCWTLHINSVPGHITRLCLANMFDFIIWMILTCGFYSSKAYFILYGIDLVLILTCRLHQPLGYCHIILPAHPFKPSRRKGQMSDRSYEALQKLYQERSAVWPGPTQASAGICRVYAWQAGLRGQL